MYNYTIIVKTNKMINRIRAKIETKLKYTNRPFAKGSYDLIIKIGKKDNRFNIDENKNNYDYILYNAPNSFNITANSFRPNGEIGYYSFIFPNNKSMNKEIVKSFDTDKERKDWLKAFYFALSSWAKDWKPFKDDKYTVKFRARENKWFFYTIKN